MKQIITLAMTVEHDTQSSIRELQPFSNRFQKLTQKNDIGCMFQWYTEWGPRPNGQFFCAAKCVLCGGKFKIMIKNRVSLLPFNLVTFF